MIPKIEELAHVVDQNVMGLALGKVNGDLHDESGARGAYIAVLVPLTRHSFSGKTWLAWKIRSHCAQHLE